MRSMHLSSSGALLSGAASIRLYQLVASVLTLLFTTSAIVRPHFLNHLFSVPLGLIKEMIPLVMLNWFAGTICTPTM